MRVQLFIEELSEYLNAFVARREQLRAFVEAHVDDTQTQFSANPAADYADITTPIGDMYVSTDRLLSALFSFVFAPFLPPPLSVPIVSVCAPVLRRLKSSCRPCARHATARAACSRQPPAQPHSACSRGGASQQTVE